VAEDASAAVEEQPVHQVHEREEAVVPKLGHERGLEFIFPRGKLVIHFPRLYNFFPTLEGP
jgi:hypothetical protein